MASLRGVTHGLGVRRSALRVAAARTLVKAATFKVTHMLSKDTIQSAVDRLAAAASSPVRVILFGSYGRGTADPGSDLDLMVIEREVADPAGEYMRLIDAVGRVARGVGVDLLIYTLSEFERRSQVPGTILFRACREGRVLHDALH